MKKTAASCALFCTLLACLPVGAQTAGVTLYGIVDLSLRHAGGLSASHAPTKGSHTTLSSGFQSASRWGLRGSEDLGAGRRALFQLESSLHADTGASGNAGKYFDRAALVGLQGDWGSLQAGRQTNLLADVLTPVEPLGQRFGVNPGTMLAALSRHDLGITFGNSGSSNSSYRLDNSIKYTGSFGGFTARAMLGLGEVAEKATALSSRGLGLTYANDKLTGSGALQTFKDANGRTLNAGTLGLAWKSGNLLWAANAGRHKAHTGVATYTAQRVLSGGVTWTVQPMLDLALAYYHVDRARTGAANDGYGRLVTYAQYKLSPRTHLYAELDNTRWRNGYQGAAPAHPATGVAVGVLHRF